MTTYYAIAVDFQIEPDDGFIFTGELVNPYFVDDDGSIVVNVLDHDAISVLNRGNDGETFYFSQVHPDQIVGLQAVAVPV